MLNQRTETVRAGRVLALIAALLLLNSCALSALISYKIDPDLPPSSGESTVEGLGAPVEIIRDQFGIPHIFADNLGDAVFGQGYAEAADRLWQMELFRRLGRGRVAEIAGEAALKIDYLYRTLNLGGMADDEYEKMEPETKSIFDSFAAGVNAFVADHPDSLGLEFSAGGIEFEPWRAADSVVVLYVMLWGFTVNWSDEILSHRIAAKVGVDGALGLLPNEAVGPGLVHYAALEERLKKTGLDQSTFSEAALAWQREGFNGGSNNWSISGAITREGKPILANDPHISGANLPSVIYASHLHTPEINAIGGSMAGVPGIVMGTNGRVAFGLTVNYADTTDLYLETIDEQDPTRYRFGDKWLPLERRVETINVKGGDPVEYEINSTIHGPLITDLADGIDQAVSLKWTLFELTASDGFIDIMTAKNGGDLRAAAEKINIPPQNMVWADVDGAIGFQVIGKIPRRSGAAGPLPVDGASGENEWDGYIPFAEIPHVENPPENYVVTANNRTWGDDYPYYVSSRYSPPYRQQRISKLISLTDRHTPDDSVKIQNDIISENAARLAARAVAAIRPVQAELHEKIKAAGDDAPAELVAREQKLYRFIDIMETFDGTMYKGDIGPTVYHFWYREVGQLIFNEKLGAELAADYLANWYMSMPVVGRLVLEGGDWCGDGDAGGGGDCTPQIVLAAEKAIDALTERFGTNIRDWRWGEVHTLTLRSPSARSGIAAKLFSYGPFPVSGDGETVMRATYAYDKPFGVIHLSALRIVVDLADPSRVLGVLSTGVSGRLYSPHYHDQADVWREGKILQWETDHTILTESAEGIFKLSPAK